MEIVPIRNEADYYRALQRAEKLWNAREGSPEREELCALVALVMAYNLERQARGENTGAISKRTKKARLLKQLRETLEGAVGLARGDAA